MARYGFLRADAVRLTHSFATFEVHTDSMVCGVLGTHFEMETSSQVTQIHVHDGTVRVQHKRSGKKTRLTKGLHAHLVHSEGRFHVSLHPLFAACTLERWSRLAVERDQEFKEREQERQRKKLRQQ